MTLLKTPQTADHHKIFISSCLLGETVRYDGKKRIYTSSIIENWLRHGFLIHLCPEVEGGLLVPREKAEKQQNDRVITVSGQDVTRSFNKGAQRTLDCIRHHGIKMAILKSKSPSCGNDFIYDGSFTGNVHQQQGITAKLLADNGIKLFDEKQLSQAFEFWQSMG